MNINVHIRYPDNMEELQIKATELLASMLIKKLEPKEIDQLVEILKNDSENITW